MSWLRIDADMPWNDKIIGLPNDTARFAFVKVLCAAKVRSRSSFSPQTLREVLGSHAKAIPALVDAHLLDEEDGRIVVHDFDKYQRLALQAERQQRYRERHTSVTPASPTGRDGTNGTYPPNPPTTFMSFPPKKVASVPSPIDLADIERQQAESLADAIRKTVEREAK